MVSRKDANIQRQKRHKRIRAKISGTTECPRLCVYRSLKNIQAILASGQDKVLPEQDTVSRSSSQYGFTRGADYYGRGNK